MRFQTAIFALFALCFCFVRAGSGVALSKLQKDSWQALQDSAKTVGDEYCGFDITTTVGEASQILFAEGLSDKFFASLNNVEVVAGDIDEASGFRSLLKQVTTNFRSAATNSSVSALSEPGKTGAAVLSAAVGGFIIAAAVAAAAVM
ncbi:hypothetical protein HK104_010484 [Borealophlyctis nickersoniae]|nr:hypothetical protein HK104_010484 [Borealophlyctis nickersoniae]